MCCLAKIFYIEINVSSNFILEITKKHKKVIIFSQALFQIIFCIKIFSYTNIAHLNGSIQFFQTQRAYIKIGPLRN